jgi:actin-like ATPase involved in cell morphogenesis
LRELQTTVAEADGFVADLLEWGAVSLAAAAGDGVAPGDSKDLPASDKARIRKLAAAFENGMIYDMLGISPKGPPGQAADAFAALVKEYDPRLYSAEELGPYGHLLQVIYDRSLQALNTLSDSRTTGSRRPPTRRRRRRRMAFEARITVRSPLWPRPFTSFSEDVSEYGLFLTSDIALPAGAPVVLEIHYGSAHRAPVTGKVAWKREREVGVCTGFGVQLDSLNTAQRLAYRQLLDAAEKGQPRPNGTLRSQYQRSEKVSPIIGIDLGTTHTTVSACIGNRVSLLPFADGGYYLPSVVAFPGRGRVRVGREAKERLYTDPRHTVASAKRLLGRSADDKEVEGHIAQAAYNVAMGPGNQAIVEMWGEHFAVSQILSYIFNEAREGAERALKTRVDKAVVTVPVSFTDEQVRLLRKGAELAHLEVVGVIEEPNAAALANLAAPGFGGLVGIYDFGGGTFDFSVVDVTTSFHVLATAGDSWLGGDDLDLAVADAVANSLWRKHRVDVRNRAVEWQQLLGSCEAAKRTLSEGEQARLHVPEVLRTRSGARDLNVKLSRGQAEQLWQEAIHRSLTTCEQSLSLLGFRASSLSGIYLSGGSTYIPAVRRALKQFGPPVRTIVPPDSSVCIGAGIHAAQIERRQARTLTWTR